MRFSGLKPGNKLPDGKTIVKFREMQIQDELIEGLCSRFNQALDALGVFAKNRRIVFAGIVEVPRQRSSREQNAQIIAGQSLETRKYKPDKLCQKDTDVRWLKKNKINGQYDGAIQGRMILFRSSRGQEYFQIA